MAIGSRLSDRVDLSTARSVASRGFGRGDCPGRSTRRARAAQGQARRALHGAAGRPDFRAAGMETRQVFGVTFEQQRNAVVPAGRCSATWLSRGADLPATARRDMLIGADHVEVHPVQLGLPGGRRPGDRQRRWPAVAHSLHAAGGRQGRYLVPASAPSRAGAVASARGWTASIATMRSTSSCARDLTQAEEELWRSGFASHSDVPQRLSTRSGAPGLGPVRTSRWARTRIIPFRDNVDRAQASGVEYIVQPGGALRDSRHHRRLRRVRHRAWRARACACFTIST